MPSYWSNVVLLIYCLSQSNPPPRSTPPGRPSVGRCNEYRPKGGDALWLGVKAGMVLFAGNTVWSIYERVRGVRVGTLYTNPHILYLLFGLLTVGLSVIHLWNLSLSVILSRYLKVWLRVALVVGVTNGCPKNCIIYKMSTYVCHQLQETTDCTQG